MNVAIEKLIRTKRVMTPWKIGTAYQCLVRMYHFTHLGEDNLEVTFIRNESSRMTKEALVIKSADF